MRKLRRLVPTLVASVVGLVLGVGAIAPTQAQAVPDASIPAPCTVTQPFGDGMTMAQAKAGITKNWGFTLVGDKWDNATYKPLVKAIWQALDAVSCTPYLATVKKNAGSLPALNATEIPGWAAGDYGLTRGGAVSLDFPQLLVSYQKDPAHVTRLFIHELTHAYSANRDSNPVYWREFNGIYARLGNFGNYGDNASEALSEVIGFYVARCTANNPYDVSKADYYAFAKKVFGGKEFGPALGKPMDCAASAEPGPLVETPPAPAPVPAPLPEPVYRLPSNLSID